MYWKDLSIFKKLGLGFGFVVLLSVVIGMFSFQGLGHLVDDATEVISGNKLDGLFAAREVDHLNWVNKVNALLTDERVNKLNIQLDDHQCAFGKWLYSEGRQQVEALVPSMASILKQIEEPHAKLHKSAVEIEKAFKVVDAELAEVPTANIEANRIFSTKTKPNLYSIQELLGQLRAEAKKHIMTDATMLASAQTTKRNVIIVSLLSVIIGTITSMFIAKSISTPIVQGVVFAETIAGGDFRSTLNIHQKDEIGILANSLNGMGANLRKIFQDISTDIQTLSGASTELSAISNQLSSNSEQTTDKANSVAAAAEEMSVNMNSVAAASEETSVNVNMVAAAAEEMSDSIGKIASNTEKTRSITEKAVTQSQDASNQINELGAAALKIGKVTETITEISEQTNLLALNATIEAARAGEAGKGFAVVANEIKDLAKQTSEATGEIKDKISKIQDATTNSVTEITQITGIISEVNEMVAKISITVEEQSNATQEIANNVSQASQGIQEVNENVAQTSSVTGEVAADIAEVGQASGEINSSSAQVHISAKELSELAERLTGMVSQFKV